MVRDDLSELSLGDRKLLTGNSIQLRDQKVPKPFGGRWILGTAGSSGLGFTE